MIKRKISNPDESFKVQMEWINGGAFWPGDVNWPFHTDAKYLFLSNEGCISYCNDEEYFKNVN